MSFANFELIDTSNVVVTFTGDKITDESFRQFLDNWNSCDLRQTNYSFYFDTRRGLGSPQIKYAFGMVRFIKEKKKEPIKYLKYSLINVNSSRNLLLLRMIFTLSSPIAPVYIFSNNSEEFIQDLKREINKSNYVLNKQYKHDNNIFCFVP